MKARSALALIALWPIALGSAHSAPGSEAQVGYELENKVLDLMFEICLPWTLGDVDPLTISIDGFSGPMIMSPLNQDRSYVVLRELNAKNRDPIAIALSDTSCEVILFQGATHNDHRQFIEDRLYADVIGQGYEFHSETAGLSNSITVFSYVNDEGGLNPMFALDNEFDGRGSYFSTEETLGLRLFTNRFPSEQAGKP